MPYSFFGQEKETSSKPKETKRTRFLNLSNTATIRILEKGRLELFTHYINRCTVECLNDDCPVCNNNRNLIMQYPDTFRDDPKYSSRTRRFLVNVLDKTLVKICQNCGEENVSSEPAIKCKCGQIVTGDPVPSNKVKVLAKGVQLFDQLDAINNAVLDTNREPIGITNYDLTLVVSGSGKTRTITPIPGEVTGEVAIDKDELFDLTKATLRLEPGEILDLQRGVSLKDIFAARKATSLSMTTGMSDSSMEIIENNAQDIVNALFKDNV